MRILDSRLPAQQQRDAENAKTSGNDNPLFMRVLVTAPGHILTACHFIFNRGQQVLEDLDRLPFTLTHPVIEALQILRRF